MTYEQWIDHAKKVITQYEEGAIFSGEVFNSILAVASEVSQIDFCFTCGLEKSECKCALDVIAEANFHNL